jgi:hypothetical protein
VTEWPKPDRTPVEVPRYILDHILSCYWADPEIEADVGTMVDLSNLAGFNLPPEFDAVKTSSATDHPIEP